MDMPQLETRPPTNIAEAPALMNFHVIAMMSQEIDKIPNFLDTLMRGGLKPENCSFCFEGFGRRRQVCVEPIYQARQTLVFVASEVA